MKKNTFGKLITLIAALILLVSMSACGKSIGTGPEVSSSIPETIETTTEQKETTTKEVSSETTTTATANQATQPAGGGNAGGYVVPGYSGGSYEPQGQPETEAPTQAPTEAHTQPPVQTWTISVSVDGGAYGGYFGGGTFTYYYPPTAYDALVSTGVGYVSVQSLYGIYISSINGLAEKAHGPMSGWLYSVNGVTPGYSSDQVYLNNGDSVYWFYQGDE